MTTITIAGEDYVEQPVDDVNVCTGCAFENLPKLCRESMRLAPEVFGGCCGKREVVYIPKNKEQS